MLPDVSITNTMRISGSCYTHWKSRAASKSKSGSIGAALSEIYNGNTLFTGNLLISYTSKLVTCHHLHQTEGITKSIRVLLHRELSQVHSHIKKNVAKRSGYLCSSTYPSIAHPNDMWTMLNYIKRSIAMLNYVTATLSYGGLQYVI